MKSRFGKFALIPGLAVVALAPLAAAPAFAAESDISVVYSTQNNADAPIDGSYTVHGRVDQTRDDMQVTYTIQSDTVMFPIPVLTYTGTFVDSSDATYTFRFDCDATVAGSDCVGYAAQVAAMNAMATSLDGRSIDTFTEDVTPIIMQFGGDVPPGIRGTVTASVTSSVPGTGQLDFFLQEGSAADAVRLSPTATTPLSITEPEITAASAGSFCVADLEEYTEGDTIYTPTNFGRDTFDVTDGVTDTGILPDDATAVGSDADQITYAVTGGSTGLSETDLETALLGSPAGTYEIGANYTASDGVPAAPIGTTVTVLGAEDANWQSPRAR